MFWEISQNSQENICAKVSKKETLALVFSCEFCGISKNTFFAEQLKATASVYEYLIQENPQHIVS